MARWQQAKPGNQDEWEEAGREAILHLLGEREVIPWHEAEARISHHGWADFPLVQPLQLTAARRQLVESGDVIVETSEHAQPVVTIRRPFEQGNKRRVERLRGARRKLYRKYIGWSQDQVLCGRHAEQVVLESARGAASGAGLFVPKQRVGHITGVLGRSIAPRTLDVLVHVLEPQTVQLECSVVVEVKNIHRWVYPWAPELWELLTKAADLAQQGAAVLPLLVCPRAAYQTWQFAKDTGFFTAQLGHQILHPDVPEADFDEVVSEFALVIQRHEGPHEHVLSFFEKTLRYSPPPTPPPEDVPWFQRQVERFRHIAPTIARFDALAENLPDDARSRVWDGARKALASGCAWPLGRGW